MTDSVMAILVNKSFLGKDPKIHQISAVLLARETSGSVSALSFLAMTEDRRKKLRVDTTKWRIHDLPEDAGKLVAKQYLDRCIEAAKQASQLHIVVSDFAIEAGVKAEPFADLPDGWRDSAKGFYERRSSASPVGRGCDFDGLALPWFIAYSDKQDLVEAFYAAWHMANRFNFFGVATNEEQGLLDGAGARPVRGSSDLRSGLNVWRQPQIQIKEKSRYEPV